MGVLPAVTAVLFITMLWIFGLTAVLLVQGRGEMAVLSAVTAVLLHHSAMGTWTDCNVVSTGEKGNCGSDYSHCSTVTSQCYDTGTDCNVVSTG